jgi:hypothetical protein
MAQRRDIAQRRGATQARHCEHDSRLQLHAPFDAERARRAMRTTRRQ